MNTARPILVVEDDPALRRLLVSALARDGHAVVGLESGSACVAWVEHSIAVDAPGAQLVISDVRMPRGDGLDLLEQLRLRAPALPVLLMTAFGDGDLHRCARLGGALDVLDKPVDIDVLRRRLRGLVAS